MEPSGLRLDSMAFGVNAVLDCTVEEMLDRGSHSIVIGAAPQRTSHANDALVYWRNSYRAPCIGLISGTDRYNIGSIGLNQRSDMRAR